MYLNGQSLQACAGMLFNFIFDPIISYFYDMLILGKPMAQLKIAWSVTTTGVNAVISVIAATIVYVALETGAHQGKSVFQDWQRKIIVT